MAPEQLQLQLQQIHDALSVYPKFQWIKSERAGIVTELKDVVFEDGITYVNFADGSRINYKFMDEYVLKVQNDVELVDLDIPKIEKQATVRASSVRPAAAVQQRKDNPIHALLSKQKPNPVDIDIAIKLNIPSPELFGVLKTSFDDAEEEIVNYIIADLDLNTIKDSVKSALKFYYEECQK